MQSRSSSFQSGCGMYSMIHCLWCHTLYDFGFTCRQFLRNDSSFWQSFSNKSGGLKKENMIALKTIPRVAKTWLKRQDKWRVHNTRATSLSQCTCKPHSMKVTMYLFIFFFFFCSLYISSWWSVPMIHQRDLFKSQQLNHFLTI